MRQKLKNFVSTHPFLLVLMTVIYAYGFFTTSMAPKLPESAFLPIQNSHTIFMLSFTAFFYLVISAGYLAYKGKKYYSDRGIKDNVPAVLSVSFLAYSVVYLGMMLESMNYVSIAATEFFMFRQTMILWAAGIAYSLVTLRTDDKRFRYGTPGAILVLSYAWFAWSLLIQNSVELAMYGFTSFVWIPLTFAFGYLFWAYSGGIGKSGLKWISVGMVYMGTTYLFWAPTQNTFMYEVAFFHYNIGASLILLGLVKTPWKQMSEVSHPLELLHKPEDK